MRVSDFGESRVLKHSDVNLTMVGTNFYIAPEVFRGDSHYDFKADVFGFGMVMLAMTVKDGNLRNFFVDQMGVKVKISANHASLRLNEGWRPDLLAHDGRITGKLDLTLDEDMRKVRGGEVERLKRAYRLPKSHTSARDVFRCHSTPTTISNVTTQISSFATRFARRRL